MQHEVQHVQLAAELLAKLLAANEASDLRCFLLDAALQFAATSPTLTDFSSAGADSSCQVMQTLSTMRYMLLYKDVNVLHTLVDLPATPHRATELATNTKAEAVET